MWRLVVALLFLTVLFVAVARLATEVTPAVRRLPDVQDVPDAPDVPEHYKWNKHRGLYSDLSGNLFR